MKLVYQNYQTEEVLGADPVKLVTILYRAAIDAVGAARRYLANGSIRERSRQITKAFEIIGELRSSLDYQRGAEISRSLAPLYVYMQQRLLHANCQQTDLPLAEVEKLLATLLEGWDSIRTQTLESLPEYVPLSCAG
jgi:flagellar secretion chaperone FliS